MRFETRVEDGVLQLRRPGTRWLSTGPSGGFEGAEAAYNLTVPEGWSRTDLDRYVAQRRDRTAFDAAGPALLTGVAIDHARVARLEPVIAVATVGLSNPAALPMAPTGEAGPGGPPEQAGTVNLLVATTRALDDGALATLLTVAVEAKTATLLALTGFPGTTTDAAIVGSTEEGEPAQFAGSATAVGSAARACVREAVTASVRSRESDHAPDTVADAEHGVVTDRRADVSEP